MEAERRMLVTSGQWEDVMGEMFVRQHDVSVMQGE